jgi:threonine dehydrogenase-like Zn-dependent dehydrogenase
MRALVWQGPFAHEIDEIESPVPAAGEVLIAVERVGICGSDVTAHKGVMGISKPGAVRGHEFAGVVTDAADSTLRVGTRVTVDPVVPCGECEACRDSRSSSCSAIEIIGVHRPGAFAGLVAAPAQNVHPVPDSLSWEAAASTEPLAQARHDVLRAAELGPLGDCLVIGSGSIGLWIVNALRIEGARSITVAEPDDSKHDAAIAAGATACVAGVDDLPAASFHTVFDVVGIAATRGAAIGRARNGGTVIAVGLGADEVSVPWFDVVRREITVRGANCFTADDFRTAVGWLATGTVTPPPSFRVVDLAVGGEVFTGIVEHTDAFTGKTFFAP